MRLQVRLPRVYPNQYEEPTVCPREGCEGQQFKPHGLQGEVKPVRDSRYEQVLAYRYQCTCCGRTFRVYPQGISADQQSDRLKALSVLLYALGLSYGGVQDLLEALGLFLSKTTVYENVQEAGGVARREQAEQVAQGGSRAVIGTDGTYLKVSGEQIGLQVVVDDHTNELLGLEIVVHESAEEVREIIQDTAEQVQAEVLTSDGLDVYRQVADQLGMAHQICRSHMKRNVDALAEELQEQVPQAKSVPAGVDSSPQQLSQDLEQIQELVRQRPADGSEQLEQLYHRYQAAPQPKVGEKQTVWCRMRRLITRLWERWHRLTLDQRRGDLDGTNNAAERLIGWWIKERYRTMRGYKRKESVRNVVTLTALIGACAGTYDMQRSYA